MELCAHQYRHGPSAMMTLVPSLMLFSLVRHIYSAFKIDNGVV